MIKVVVADDHPLVRRSLRRLLDANPGILVVGEAEDGPQAVALAAELRPDVVVMDIAMPGMDGITATAKILASGARHPRVLMLSMYAASHLVGRALDQGAVGYVLKRSSAAEIVRGVIAASKGERFLSAGLAPR